jgi:hypothetical protein
MQGNGTIQTQLNNDLINTGVINPEDGMSSHDGNLT